MRTPAVWCGWIALWLAAPHPASAQARAVTVDEIEAAVALDDRTLVITAPRTPAVLRVDMERGTTVVFGRRGEGPGEYRWPVQPVVMRDGRIAVFDVQGSSVVSWRQDGTAGSRRAVRPLSQPRVAADGALYGEATQVIPTRTAVDAERDPMPLIRFPPGSTRPDTIGQLTMVREVVVGPFRGITPDFATDDLWGVTPDGTVWIARASTNQVERLAPGSTKWVASPPRPWTAIRSTRAEERPLQVTMPNRPPEIERLRQPMAAVKAPFTHAIADRNGDVWLRLQPVVGERTSRYAVFPADGSASHRTVTLPPNRLVVAFSNAFLFTKHETEDGEWVLERVSRAGLSATR